MAWDEPAISARGSMPQLARYGSGDIDALCLLRNRMVVRQTAAASTKADAGAMKMSGEAEPLQHGADIAWPDLHDRAIFHFECDESLAEPLHRFH